MPIKNYVLTQNIWVYQELLYLYCCHPRTICAGTGQEAKSIHDSVEAILAMSTLKISVNAWATFSSTVLNYRTFLFFVMITSLNCLLYPRCFLSVVVITHPSHGWGRRFDPGRKHGTYCFLIISSKGFVLLCMVFMSWLVLYTFSNNL